MHYLSKYLLAIILIASCATTYAQDTTYVNEDQEKVNKDAAEAYIVRTNIHDSTYRFVKRKMTNNVLLTEGLFVNIDSQFYMGPWKYYTDSGILKMEGNFVRDKKEGNWKHYYKNSSKVWYTEDMKNNRNDGPLKSYYKSGKLKRIEMFDKGKSVSGSCYAENGKEIEFTQFTVMAAPGYDMIQYLGANVTYPDSARNKEIEGRVKAKFVVNEDGSISNIKITKSVGYGCDEEVIRVLSKMPRWKPGKQDDVLIKVMYTQPVSFKLE